MTKYNSCTDEELVALAQQNDSMAVDMLLEKYKPLVRKKARALYLIGGDNDDLIQEGMISLYKSIRDYDLKRENSFGSFASVCIERHLYNVIKGANTKKNSPLNTYVSLYEPTGNAKETGRETLADTLQPRALTNPEEIVIDRENVTDLEKAIESQLSDFEQEVVRLYLEGNDYQQIAKILDKSAKSIDNALQRVKKKLSYKLKKAVSGT
ncbi:MAG: RNA polymerase sporulation sigma factor SigH [Eubacterium sp.]|nr:RNA polymerase sporulation sigma factor SigH [Eubacterium sp.]